MKTTLFGCVLSALMLASCSSEHNVTEPVRLSDIVNTGCTRSFSAKESRPEYYRSEMEKKPQVSILNCTPKVRHKTFGVHYV